MDKKDNLAENCHEGLEIVDAEELFNSLDEE